MDIQELANVFQAKFNVEGIEIKDGACVLKIDDHEVDFAETADGSAIVVTGLLGETPNERPDVFLGMLLGANMEMMAGDALAFAQLPDGGGIVLVWRAASSLDADAFCKGLEEFVNTIERWETVIADYRPAAAAAEEIDDAPPPPSSPGFMLV